MEDVQCMDSSIYECALSHIYSNEVILTYGYSRTVLNFLRKAHRKDRTFEVLVAECAPTLSGQRMAAALAQTGVPVTLIADAAVLAVMPSVSKVLLGAHAVLANGGLVAHTGASNLCLCAQHRSVPVVVLAGLHKLTPLHAFNQDTFNEHECPAQLLRFDEALEGRVDAVNPCFDHVPPELVALIVTDSGACAPAYVHKHLAELYAPEFFTL
jgi:translation initiation factor eIF-2B subunit beta